MAVHDRTKWVAERAHHAGDGGTRIDGYGNGWIDLRARGWH